MGGGIKIIFEYANYLKELGHEVNIIYPLIPILTHDKRYNTNLNRLVGMISNIKKGNKVDWFNLKVELKRVISLNERSIPFADIIIATWWETAFYVNKYSDNKGKKFYFVQGYEIWGGADELVHKSYELDLHKIVIANWLYEKLIDLGIPKSEISHIPNALNFEIFRLTENIGDESKRIVMQFNKNIFKGSLDGINALKLAKKEYPKLKAVLFGTSLRPNDLPSWIEYVQTPSQKELVEEIYNKSSIYLCPSWSEGWHLPPAEAMACGCALVSTDIGGVKDYAINEKTALLSPLKNSEMLAENLINLLEDDNLRLKLAYEGNKNIKQFTWEKSSKRLEELFNSFKKSHSSNKKNI